MKERDRLGCIFNLGKDRDNMLRRDGYHRIRHSRIWTLGSVISGQVTVLEMLTVGEDEKAKCYACMRLQR